MSSIDISASALTAQRVRLDVIAENLANAETTRTANGSAYHRLQAVLEANSKQGGVSVKEIVQDAPAVNARVPARASRCESSGYVAMPNVNPIEEMVDMIAATRSYEANVTALNASKTMTQKALEIGRG